MLNKYIFCLKNDIFYSYFFLERGGRRGAEGEHKGSARGAQGERKGSKGSKGSRRGAEALRQGSRRGFYYLLHFVE